MTRPQRRDRRPWARVENAVRRMRWVKCERALVDALKARYQGQARIYCGDLKLAGANGRPWQRGEANRCSPSSIRRAKLRLEKAGILAVVHTQGGYTRNPAGQIVPAATGYEPHPDLYLEAPPPRRRAGSSEVSVEAIAAGKPIREPLSAVWARIAARKALSGGRDGP